MFRLNRRAFIATAGAAAIVKPSFATPIRDPYVMPNESVNSIIWHLWDDPRNPAPLSPLFVGSIDPWDGIGYPITLFRCDWSGREYFTGFYDFEWSNLRRDVPADFWNDPSRRDRYINVHSYVREARFDEHPSAMRERMEFNQLHTLAEQQASNIKETNHAG